MQRPLVLLAIIVALAVGAGSQPAAAQETSGVVAIDCDGMTEGIQETCVYDTGETFLVQVHITEVPPDGYNGFELRVSWTVPQLAYRPAEEFEEEFPRRGVRHSGKVQRMGVDCRIMAPSGLHMPQPSRIGRSPL